MKGAKTALVNVYVDGLIWLRPRQDFVVIEQLLPTACIPFLQTPTTRASSCWNCLRLVRVKNRSHRRRPAPRLRADAHANWRRGYLRRRRTVRRFPARCRSRWQPARRSLGLISTLTAVGSHLLRLTRWRGIRPVLPTVCMLSRSMDTTAVMRWSRLPRSI